MNQISEYKLLSITYKKRIRKCDFTEHFSHLPGSQKGKHFLHLWQPSLVDFNQICCYLSTKYGRILASEVYCISLLPYSHCRLNHFKLNQVIERSLLNAPFTPQSLQLLLSPKICLASDVEFSTMFLSNELQNCNNNSPNIM